MAGGVTLIDIRELRYRLAEGVVPGSVHVPLSVLPWRADPSSEVADPRISDVDAPLILMCNDGYSSSLAADWLRKLGFGAVSDLDGGFRAWAAAGLPVTSTSDDPENHDDDVRKVRGWLGI